MDCTIVGFFLMMQDNKYTLYKVWISTLLNNPYMQPAAEGEFGYIAYKELKISRVNLLAPVIQTDIRENFSTITIDDGSATIQVRAFKEDAGMLQGIHIGDLVNVLGKVREYLNVIYITPDVVKKLDNPAWMTVRKLELKKWYGEPEAIVKKEQEAIVQSQQPAIPVTPQALPQQPQPEEKKAEEKITQSPRKRVLTKISEAGDEGINIDLIIQESQLPEQEAEELITELLKEGEIYMPRPGRIKIV